MLPIRRKAVALAARRLAVRSQHSRSTEGVLTGADKLFADAALEDSQPRAGSSRDHLRQTQGEIWTGEENQVDAVLRMLVDAHKPLRSGTPVTGDTADMKIRGMLANLKLDLRPSPSTLVEMVDPEAPNAHRTTLPPHLHRPWHATYTGAKTDLDGAPKIKYGTFIRKRASAEDLSNILELQLPPGADGKTRSRIREARRSHRKVTRLDSAREGALDYRLGQEDVAMVEDAFDADDETFTGNRQVKGSSVLGTQKGGASGLRAWQGLVEDRIQRAREAGRLTPTKGLGKPIPKDENAGNPYIDSGELLMNRIVKRQGALPPWIELQNNLDAALNSFRATVLSTYTTYLVRNIIATNTLDVQIPDHAIPDHDEIWEARERKFHEENVKQINDLVRRFNAQAPASSIRRPLITLDLEIARARRGLRESVLADVRRRAADHKAAMALPRKSSPYYIESESLSRLGQATRRSLWTLARPLRAVIGRGAGGGNGGGSESSGAGLLSGSDRTTGRPYGLFLLAGVGVVGVIYLRQPTRNDSVDDRPVKTASSTVQPDTSHPAPRLRPVSFVTLYILEPVLTFFRFLHLAVLFGPVILTSPMLFIGKVEKRRRGKPIDGEDENWGAVWWYGFLVKQMERAGPSFIKLGQWAASRADLFPAALCDLMSKLHSNGKPHSLRHTRKALEGAFGLKFDEVFSEFDETPIGCGAIAQVSRTVDALTQVYRGKLRTDLIPASHDHSKHSPDLVPTTSVAIKVLHPRVRQLVRRDIAIMSVFAGIINLFPGMSWLSLPEEVQVFGEMMNQQLDLRVEGANLERFERNFAGRGARVVFPRPIRLGLMGDGQRDESREVLMEEFEDALPLKYFLKHGGGPYDNRIASIGLDAFLVRTKPAKLMTGNAAPGQLDSWRPASVSPIRGRANERGNIMVRFYKPTPSDLFAPLISRFTKAKEQDLTEIPEHSLSADALVHSLSSVAHNGEKWLHRLDELESQGFEPQLIFIDAGLVTSLDTRNRRDFLDLFQAVAEFDGYKAGKLMVERCRTPEYAIDEETFALKIQHLVLSVKSKTFSLAKIKISDILTDVLTAVRQHHVKLEGDFVNTVISILLLEGIGRQLDPEMDLFKSALPILRQVGRQMGTREAISAVPKGNIWAMIKVSKLRAMLISVVGVGGSEAGSWRSLGSGSMDQAM